MATRRGCTVNSLWSGTERVRIGERLKATLAGLLELEVLRYKHLDLVDGALQDRADTREESRNHPESCGSDPGHGSATSRGQQDSSPSDAVEDYTSNSGDGAQHFSSGKGTNCRWSTLSWDAPSELLTPPTPDPTAMSHIDSDSRPSSGFYSVSGSSLSDSSYSVSSEAAHGAALPVRPDTTWSSGALQLQQLSIHSSQEDSDPTAVYVSSRLDATGLSFLSDLCAGLSDSLVSSLLPLLNPSSSSSVHLQPKLDSRYCTDLVSRRTKEVYSYPSPLHAVALQSPLFTSPSQEQLSCANADDEDPNDTTLALPPQQPLAPVSVTQLEQYISRLARQYHSRLNSSTSDLTSCTTPGPVTNRGFCTPGKSHGSTQSLSAFESRSTSSVLTGGSITPSKSLLGNSARVSISTTGKKSIRNSINLGNLPSATGEDLNINLHLNFNLNLAPGVNSSCGVVETPKKGTCGALRTDFSSPSSLSSAAPTPAVRSRPRISTCPSSLSHRSSLEVPLGTGASSTFGSSAFCQSLDWSTSAPPEPGHPVFATSAASAPASQRSSLIQESNTSSKVSEDFPMVEEISRLSGLSQAVVLGLMEQGVELDIDCFPADSRNEPTNQSKAYLTARPDHDYSKQTELSPQRPMQLSLSVTHSPQSQSSLTPPLSHSSSPQPMQNPSIHHKQIPLSSDLPSSTASSPASRPMPRSRSPPHPLHPSPLGATPLSVFRRDAPFQCSLPRFITRNSPVEHGGIQPRGGSLRQGGGGNKWNRDEGEGLYKGKHASHKLVRAATVSSYAKREDHYSAWGDEEEKTPRKSSGKLWRGFEGRLWGKDSENEKEEMDRAEYGYGWRRNSIGSWRRAKTSSSSSDKKPKAENSPIFSRKRGKDDGDRRSSSLRLSRRALFRSESQGLLVPHTHNEEPTRRAHWVSSFDVGQGSIAISRNDGVKLLRGKEEDKRLSSTASLFNLSHSQSLEGSCQSLSPLSSCSFSPSPTRRMPLQHSRSLKDLGKRVFGSMRSLSLRRKSSKK
ncbi:mucin-12 [Gouania willdenowi]|uniref:Mucin-12-like n=1 Tax=Gouania willdenowi TaxID=441366 RepID=A0A8C5GRH2_GOUWI|nr:mucin-12-like [Gouania willdenowi]